MATSITEKRTYLDLVSIDSLRSGGDRVRANVFTVEQGLINSTLINAALAQLTRNGSRPHGLYIPGKSYAIGPKLVTLQKTGTVIRGPGATSLGGVFGYLNTYHVGNHAALIKVSHFNEPIIEVSGGGTFISGLTLEGAPKSGDDSPLPRISITNASNATPIVITTQTDHCLDTGCYVTITGVAGNTNANGTWRVTRLTDDTFSLFGSFGNDDFESSDPLGSFPSCAVAGIRISPKSVTLGSPTVGNEFERITFVHCNIGFDIRQVSAYSDMTMLRRAFFSGCPVNIRIDDPQCTSFDVDFMLVSNTDDLLTSVICDVVRGGGLTVQKLNINPPCTVLNLQTNLPGRGYKFENVGIDPLFFRQLSNPEDHSSGVLVNMEAATDSPIRISGAIGGDFGMATDTQWIRWKHRPGDSALQGFFHPDIQIDMARLRKDQAYGFPNRPGWQYPIPMPYTTSAFSSTKLWLKAWDQTGWTVGTESFPLIQVAADASGQGNHLSQATSGSRPTFKIGGFNHRDAIYAELQTGIDYLYRSTLTGFSDIGDMEIMFPFMLTYSSPFTAGTYQSLLFAGNTGGTWAFGIFIAPYVTGRGWPIYFNQRLGTGEATNMITTNYIRSETPYLLHLRRHSTGEVHILIDGLKSTKSLGPGALATPATITLLASRNGGTDGSPSIIQGAAALIPELFIDTAMLTQVQLTERKRYLRAAYGVWDGTLLDAAG